MIVGLNYGAEVHPIRNKPTQGFIGYTPKTGMI